MAVFPNPYQAEISKTLAGATDTYITNGVYKFLGCSITSCSMSLGFNGTASSLSVTLAEDTRNGDAWSTAINVPFLCAFSLPTGGVGQSIFLPDGTSLAQATHTGANVPFYFAGICTAWSQDIINTGGRLINVTITDGRDLLNNVQCILSNHSVSESLLEAQRYADIKNFIDVFGYYDWGNDSGKNEYGIPWYKIKDAIEDCRIKINDIWFEFSFVGDTFEEVPDFYRIDDDIIDIVSLACKVATDSGSDVMVVGRKRSGNEILIEFRGIKRNETDDLKKSELSSFITARQEIVESACIGQEHKTEPMSSMVIGGRRNTNYVAWPTPFASGIHFAPDTEKEDWNSFPDSIKTRIFGGDYTKVTDSFTAITLSSGTFNTDVGAIMPFWGYTPDDYEVPLVEPFISFDHYFFDKVSEEYAEISKKIPNCQISIGDFTVRTVPHNDTFLTGDGDSDIRPFAFISDIDLSDDKPEGYIKGLPINTHLLNLAITSDDIYTFFTIYSMYYPDIANRMKLPKPNLLGLNEYIDEAIAASGECDLRNIDIFRYFISTDPEVEEQLQTYDFSSGSAAKALLGDLTAMPPKSIFRLKFFKVMFEIIRQYAVDNLGKKFIVCLPKSFIMERIWNEQSVPTRPEQPEIEYVIDSAGFWDTLPTEFDGMGNGGTYSDEEMQIRKTFMQEDGRFKPMAVIDWKPYGNASFNSNGLNKAMFQDLSTSDFAPNKLALGNPEFVCVSISAHQLTKRPDLALIELPNAIEFDPCEYDNMYKFTQSDDSWQTRSKSEFIKFFWTYLRRSEEFFNVAKKAADYNGAPIFTYMSQIIEIWASKFSLTLGKVWMTLNTAERVLDLKAVILPLTSTVLSYGPWCSTYEEANGSVGLIVDEGLVPWNFYYPKDLNPIDPPLDDGYTPAQRLDIAGQERLERTMSPTDYVDSATIVVAGFPEYGHGQRAGYNSNLTSICVNFGIDGIKTSYNFATYSARPGTFRKDEYDNLNKAKIDTRAHLPSTQNISLLSQVFEQSNRRNRFRD